MYSHIREQITQQFLDGYADQIGERVRETIKTKKRLQGGPLGDHERERLERETEAHEQRINQPVCQLYGVDEIPAD